ncbi:hypothetical protein [Flavobacterium pallidum]|uniref:Uncharacterized protein n=1 Tax=Flavobacterium pallidum TaxID=2172098 RepID=A0A2S1SHI2_9FLAO|nr:hypothetical protein [Flavobacterium pallidum]AWI25802.1 hypothetical protein HYN49_07745 [Flavobacterium pallidum]
MGQLEGTSRLCIHTKDMVLLTGYSEGYCRRVIREIRTRNNKKRHQPVTISEFCSYLGFEEEAVRKRLY